MKINHDILNRKRRSIRAKYQITYFGSLQLDLFLITYDISPLMPICSNS